MLIVLIIKKMLYGRKYKCDEAATPGDHFLGRNPKHPAALMRHCHVNTGYIAPAQGHQKAPTHWHLGSQTSASSSTYSGQLNSACSGVALGGQEGGTGWEGVELGRG